MNAALRHVAIVENVSINSMISDAVAMKDFLEKDVNIVSIYSS